MKKILFLTLILMTLNLFSEDYRFINFDKNSLLKIKKEISSDKYQDALKKLKSNADKFLKEEIHTVVEKKEIPPSKDKHDYISLATYYWPDPSKKDGLPYIRKDGQTNPEINDIKDKRYFESMPGKVLDLSLYYFFSGEEKYAGKAVDILNAWFVNKKTMMNPNLNFSQAIKGKNDGRSAGILDGRNLAKIPDAIEILKKSKYYNDAFEKNIKLWFEKYFDWLTKSKNGLNEAGARNNHGTWYDVQAVGIAIFLGNNEYCQKIFKQAMEKRIPHQIDKDGKQPEELQRTKALSYSTFNLTAWSILAEYAKLFDINLWLYETMDGRGLKKALEYLLPYYTGEKEFEYKQIKDFEPDEFYPMMIKASLAYNDIRYLKIIKTTAKEESLKSIKEILLYYDLKF